MVYLLGSGLAMPRAMQSLVLPRRWPAQRSGPLARAGVIQE